MCYLVWACAIEGRHRPVAGKRLATNLILALHIWPVMYLPSMFCYVSDILGVQDPLGLIFFFFNFALQCHLLASCAVKMKGDRHDTVQDIQKECTAVLNVIPQKEYSDCFWKLFNLFQLCIDSEGDNFEWKEWNFENNSRLIFLMNTVLTEPGHTV
jgi:hypothetical protein